MLDRAIDRFEREKSGATASISVYKNYSPDIPPVAFDAELMERVISNLIMNAAQASPPGRSGHREDAARRAARLEIAVIDRGSGIDPKNLENIFNPFFTTKSDGVGLGLAIVRRSSTSMAARSRSRARRAKAACFASSCRSVQNRDLCAAKRSWSSRTKRNSAA